MASGYITAISSRTTKFGDYWDVIVGPDKLGVGKFPPKGLAVGDYVNYETEMNGQYKNLKAGSLVKAAAPAGSTAPAPPTPSAPSAITKDRQDVISAQWAHNAAFQHVANLISAGALPTGAAKGKKLADMIDSITNEYAMRFHSQATGASLDIEALDAGMTNANASDIENFDE